MSSHREAPELIKDPVADNTDVYVFVSPDQPDTVTLISNYIPFQYPPGGPNFYEFGEDVLYEIHIDNNGDAKPDITYQFRFNTTLHNTKTFLYNTGPITSLDDSNWNRRQFYSVTRVDANGDSKVLAEGLSSPPCNIGPLSTPNYASLASAAVHNLASGEKVFAGQRAEGFYIDIGGVFDLLDLRPFQNLHLIPKPAMPGVDGLQGFNVNTIAIQVPKTALTGDGSNPTDAMSAKSVIGVFASASRQRARIYENGNAKIVNSGPFVQVSRLANPLFNEALIPMAQKDLWNSSQPSGDSEFASHVEHPEVAALLPVLYPGVFPNLAKLKAARKDLVAILLTGIPPGIVPGFQNYTGKTMADLMRLNMAIPPTRNPNVLGLIGGDPAGFPNGRRVEDDVFTIELRSIAGVTYALVDKSYTPDAAAGKVTNGVTNTNQPYMGVFPYLGLPNSGFQTTPPESPVVPGGMPETGEGGMSRVTDAGMAATGRPLW